MTSTTPSPRPSPAEQERERCAEEFPLARSAGEGRGECVWKEKRNDQSLKAKALRKEPTEAEKLFWQKVRNKQVNNYKFKRQFPIGPYIADFVCIELLLVVEIDGGQHNENEHDKIRTAFLESKGYSVVRFWNNEVLSNIDGVVQSLTLTLSRRERELGGNLGPQ